MELKNGTGPRGNESDLVQIGVFSDPLGTRLGLIEPNAITVYIF